MLVHTLTHLYSSLLRLYPRSFQDEFAEEMREVFSQAAGEALVEGRLALGRLYLKELAGLPASIWRAHYPVYANQQTSGRLALQSSRLEQSWKELLLALAVFLLPAVMVVINQAPPVSSSIGLPAALLFVVVMIAIGWLGGLPLWSVPYAGIILIIAAYLYLFQWIADLISPSLISNFSPGPWDHSTYLMLEIFSTGMVWLMLFSLTLLVVALLAVFNRFQPLWVRIRHDWTLLSYILYGESFFVLVLLFESHRYDPSYAIASLLCLGAGIWLYLRSPKRSQRLLALVSCLTLAVGFAAMEKSQLTSSTEWETLSNLRPPDSGRLLLSWVWMMVALLLPGMLSRLPPVPSQKPPADSP